MYNGHSKAYSAYTSCLRHEAKNTLLTASLRDKHWRSPSHSFTSQFRVTNWTLQACFWAVEGRKSTERKPYEDFQAHWIEVGLNKTIFILFEYVKIINNKKNISLWKKTLRKSAELMDVFLWFYDTYAFGYKILTLTFNVFFSILTNYRKSAVSCFRPHQFVTLQWYTSLSSTACGHLQ